MRNFDQNQDFSAESEYPPMAVQDIKVISEVMQRACLKPAIQRSQTWAELWLNHIHHDAYFVVKWLVYQSQQVTTHNPRHSTMRDSQNLTFVAFELYYNEGMKESEAFAGLQRST